MFISRQKIARSLSSTKSINSKKSDTSKRSISSKRSIFGFRKKYVCEDRNPANEDGGDLTLTSGFARDISEDVKNLCVEENPTPMITNNKITYPSTEIKAHSSESHESQGKSSIERKSKGRSKGRSIRRSKGRSRSRHRSRNQLDSYSEQADYNRSSSGGCMENDFVTDYIFPVDGSTGLKRNSDENSIGDADGYGDIYVPIQHFDDDHSTAGGCWAFGYVTDFMRKESSGSPALEEC